MKIYINYRTDSEVRLVHIDGFGSVDWLEADIMGWAH